MSYIKVIVDNVNASKNVTKEINTLIGKREGHNLTAYAGAAVERFTRGIVQGEVGAKTEAGDLKADLVAAGVKVSLAKRLSENGAKMVEHEAFAECFADDERDENETLALFARVYSENEIKTQNDLLLFLGSKKNKTPREKIEEIFKKQSAEQRMMILGGLVELHAEMENLSPMVVLGTLVELHENLDTEVDEVESDEEIAA